MIISGSNDDREVVLPLSVHILTSIVTYKTADGKGLVTTETILVWIIMGDHKKYQKNIYNVIMFYNFN